MAQCEFSDRELSVICGLATLHAFTTRSIAELFDCSSATISAWVRKKGVRVPRSSPPPHPGKNLKTRRKFINTLVMQTREILNKAGEVIRVVPEYDSLQSLKAALEKKGIFVSRQTVSSDLEALDYVCRVRPKVPDTSQKDSEVRFTFCKFYMRMSNRWFRCLVFTDEKIFTSNDGGCRTQFVPRNGGKPLRRERRRWPRVRVMCWGAIGAGGFRHLVIFPELAQAANSDDAPYGRPASRKGFRLTSEKYIRLCLSPIADQLVSESRILQEDGAGAHNTHGYTDRKGIETLEKSWPARSPQLSPIEDVWSLLQARVSTHYATTREELITALQYEWDHLTTLEVDNFVLSFKKRLVDCYAANGVV